MTFTDFGFVVFCPLVFLACYLLPAKVQNTLLLAASLAFYAAWRAPHLLAALGLCALAAWGAARGAGGAAGPRRAGWIWGGVTVVVLTAVIAKYPALLPGSCSTAWFPTGCNAAPASAWVTVGISFFALQAISYLVDVNLERLTPELRFDRFLLYLAFFPKLLQGPLERAGDLLPQWRNPRPFAYNDVRQGLLTAFGGLFKKVVLADRIGLFIDPVFAHPEAFEGVVLLAAVYLYAAQIYLDFSGYTDMARGLGRCFGIRLSPNFNRPYAAQSIPDFWRRWHITFSAWLLDYLFRPLQMFWRRGGVFATAAAALVTFLFSGLWHGATWNYLVWGGLHGLFLACSAVTASWRKKVVRRHAIFRGRWASTFRTLFTFHLVCAAWVFFRTATLREGWHVLTHWAGRFSETFELLAWREPVEVFCLAAALLASLLVRRWARGQDPVARVLALPPLPRWGAYYLAVTATWLLAAYTEGRFIYFRF